jgi:hypothetical protein
MRRLCFAFCLSVAELSSFFYALETPDPTHNHALDSQVCRSIPANVQFAKPLREKILFRSLRRRLFKKIANHMELV